MKAAMCTAVLFAALFGVNSVFAVPQDIREILSRASAERNYPEILKTLEHAEAEDATFFNNNNYDYLLARTAARIGDNALAAKYFAANVDRGSLLAEYSLWHLARIAGNSGNLMLERIYLDELRTFYPDSILRRAAEYQRSRSLFAGSEYRAAVKAFNELGAPTASAPYDTFAARRSRAYIAKAEMYSGNATAAREAATPLVFELPDPSQPDDLALEGARILDMLDAKAIAPQQRTDLDHLRFAHIYQFNRDFPNARIHFGTIINEHSDSGVVPDALFQIGLGYAREGNFTEAIKWFERTQEQFPDHPVNEDSLMNAASAYTRVGKNRESIARYQRYIERFPDGERIDRAYLNIIDVLRDDGQETEALLQSKRVQDKFAGGPAAAQGLFAEARIHLAKDDWAAAIEALSSLENLPGLSATRNRPGGTDRDEVKFLKAFALEQLRRFPEAIDLYLSIPDGREEYYGARATERLRVLAKTETAAPSILAKRQSLSAEKVTKDSIHALLRLDPPAAEREKLLVELRGIYSTLSNYKDLPHFTLMPIGRRESNLKKPDLPATTQARKKAIADELLFLGLFDEAIPAFEASGPAGSSDLNYTVAVLSARGGNAGRTASFIEPLWKKPSDYQIELIPENVAELLYPTPFADELLEHSTPRNVDPRFLLSIMRQESRFRSNVRSNAAARGSMQFISTTSDKIAGQLGLDNFRQDDLYDPEIAILFGSQYTAELFRMFPNSPQAVAASYNGGEDNMQRWYNRSRSDNADLYTAEIAFAQSKDYVFKVMTNYRMYQTLYDSGLKRK